MLGESLSGFDLATKQLTDPAAMDVIFREIGTHFPPSRSDSAEQEAEVAPRRGPNP